MKVSIALRGAYYATMAAFLVGMINAYLDLSSGRIVPGLVNTGISAVELALFVMAGNQIDDIEGRKDDV